MVLPTVAMVVAVQWLGVALGEPHALVRLVIEPLVGAAAYFTTLWAAHPGTFRLLVTEAKGFVKPAPVG